MKHYSEAELLEGWYTAPGSSLPAMLHLADCPDCAARYERLEAKLHSLVSCPHRHAQRRRVIDATIAALIAAIVLLSVSWPLVGMDAPVVRSEQSPSSLS